MLDSTKKKEDASKMYEIISETRIEECLKYRSMNNKYIKDESQRNVFLEEGKKRNRFIGLVLILVMLLFILPTYNLFRAIENHTR